MPCANAHAVFNKISRWNGPNRYQIEMPGLIPHPLLAPKGDHRQPVPERLNTWQQYFTFDNPPNMRIITRTTQ